MLDQIELGERLEHRHLDVLALARAQLVDDRRERCIGRVEPRDLVRDQRRDVARARVPIDARGEAGRARRGLDHVVIGRLVGIRAVLPKADAVDVDDAWIERLRAGIVEPEPLERLAAHVEDHHVALAHQPVHRRQIVGILEVERG